MISKCSGPLQLRCSELRMRENTLLCFSCNVAEENRDDPPFRTSEASLAYVNRALQFRPYMCIFVGFKFGEMTVVKVKTLIWIHVWGHFGTDCLHPFLIASGQLVIFNFFFNKTQLCSVCGSITWCYIKSVLSPVAIIFLPLATIHTEQSAFRKPFVTCDLNLKNRFSFQFCEVGLFWII